MNSMKVVDNKKKKYFGIDWLRAFACIGIACMHIAENSSFEIDDFFYKNIIPSFTDLVYLFMAISAFGMCCGYFERVLAGKINWSDFYKKRYIKILPFFAILVCLDVIMDFSLGSLYEGITEVTLLHGFIPDELTVIGVGWFLGTVFVFYLVFPFFCVLIENKQRALFTFVVSIVLNYICGNYYHDLGRKNFVYSLCFFILGGIIYLYKKELEGIKYYFFLPMLVVALACYYGIGENTITRLLVSAILLSFAISLNCEKVKVISFISGISMEIYLSHMLMFRVVEKVHLNSVLGNGWLQYIFTICLVLLGAIIFAYVFQWITNKIKVRMKRNAS